MSQSQTDTDKDEPLGPEAEAILAKARRRAGLSMLVMMVGFMAIAVVVVYRLATMGSDPAERYALETIALPAGAQVISTQVQDGLVTVTYGVDGAQAIRIFHGATGELAREIAVVVE